MLLSAAQIDHWVVLYDVKEKSDREDGWDKTSWETDKEWLKQDFPFINLPYLVDCSDDTVLCQTNAILTYLGRELKLLGTTKREICQCEELLCEIMDLRNIMVRFAYARDEKAIVQDAVKMLINADRYFQKFEQHLMAQYPNAKDRVVEREEIMTYGFYWRGVCHLVSGKFSAPDFHLWEMLQQFEGLCRYLDIPNCLGDATTCSEQVDAIETWKEPSKKTSKYPYLKEFSNGFIHLFANQAYGTMFRLNGVICPRALRLPYNNAYARFGSAPEAWNETQKIWIPGKYIRGQKHPWKGKGVIKNSQPRLATGIEYWDDDAMKRAREKQTEFC